MSHPIAPDPFIDFKSRQRQMWDSFAPAALFTTPVAGHLVRFAQIRPGEAVLDVATGTGVAAITAARAGAKVNGLDLNAGLLEHARDNARLAGLDIVWTEGDAESLPYRDASFDAVLSQFGHMFAPRADVAVNEIRRVLKPGGRFAFASWPPEHFIGRLFAFLASQSPIPPAGDPPPLWGSPAIIIQRLAGSFEPPFFERGTMRVPALSVAHLRTFTEKSVGPMQKLVEAFAGNPEKLAALRAGFDALIEPYYRDNEVHQDYLLTVATAI